MDILDAIETVLKVARTHAKNQNELEACDTLEDFAVNVISEGRDA